MDTLSLDGHSQWLELAILPTQRPPAPFYLGPPADIAYLR